MAPYTRNPRAGDAGARDRLARQLDGPNRSENRHALQPSPSPAYVDEVLFRLADRLRLGRLDGWERDFARSLLGQAKRGGPRWRPSAKQLGCVQRILEKPNDHAEEEVLIEEAGDDRPA